MPESIKYVKLNKTDKNGNVLDFAKLADAGYFNIIHNNGSSSKFTINEVGDFGDHLFLKVTTTTQVTSNVIVDNNIAYYTSFSANLYPEAIVNSEHFTPVQFSQSSTPPQSQDGWSIEGVDHPTKGILSNIGIYNFGKQPNVSIRFFITGAVSCSNADYYQFILLPRRSYLNQSTDSYFWDLGDFSFGDAQLTAFETPYDMNTPGVLFSGSVPETSSIGNANLGQPLKVGTGTTSISMSCDIRADLLNSGSGWLLAIRKLNESNETASDVTLKFTANTSMSLSISPFSVGYTTSSPLTSSSPTAPGLLSEQTWDEKFQNSDNEVTINNYNQNRPNSYIEEIDYTTDAKTPVNLTAIINKTATKAQIPDSNYTSEKIINPRYNGSRLSSLTYNTYTGPQTLRAYNFLNGDTGSWTGDVSYGNTSTIDKNPIYFAHFKESVENKELFDSYTFKIDALIESPRNDIQGTSIEPKIIKIDGSNENMESVISTFEKGRKSLVAYGQVSKDGVDYSTLAVGDSTIFQGGLEYHTIFSNTIDEKTFSQTQSFFENVNWCGVFQNPSATEVLLTGSKSLILRGSVVGQNCGYTCSIGNDPYLLGQNTHSTAVAGPQLGIFNSMNNWVSKSLALSGSSGDVKFGLPAGTLINPANQFNYLRFNFTESLVDEYSDFNPYFLIKRGDEIRTIYNAVSGANPEVFVQQDFTVESVETSSSPSTDGYIALLLGSPDNHVVTMDNTPIYNKLIVDPDPSTLEIPDGKIFSMTIRRRVEADDRVIVFQTPPSGSMGSKTPTGDGFLIPKDFTQTQKLNVQSLITQLKGKNTFRDSDQDS
jgi:hypothetical protein